MLATELYQLQSAELKVVTPGEAAMHAIPGQEELLGMPDQQQKALDSDAFNIKFKYNGQLHQTKAIKISAQKDGTFYKVVIGSRIGTEAGVYWLQPQSKGWAVLLGKTLDEKLIQAIAEAIEAR